MNDIEKLALEVLAGQSPGYLIQPHAAAFQAVGIEPADALLALESLSKGKHVEHAEKHETIEYETDDGELEMDEPVLVDAGWQITTKGRAALSK